MELTPNSSPRVCLVLTLTQTKMIKTPLELHLYGVLQSGTHTLSSVIITLLLRFECLFELRGTILVSILFYVLMNIYFKN